MTDGIRNMVRAGEGWNYDRADFTYDEDTDVEGRDVKYDSVGTAPTITNLSKSSLDTS